MAKKYRPPEFVRAVQERRRSGAAGPHNARRTRGDVRRAEIRASRKGE